MGRLDSPSWSTGWISLSVSTCIYCLFQLRLCQLESFSLNEYCIVLYCFHCMVDLTEWLISLCIDWSISFVYLAIFWTVTLQVNYIWMFYSIAFVELFGRSTDLRTNQSRDQFADWLVNWLTTLTALMIEQYDRSSDLIVCMWLINWLIDLRFLAIYAGGD